jgi:hypothetical protein
VDNGIPIVRVLNDGRPFEAWQTLARSSYTYLIDVSSAQSDVLRSWPSDLLRFRA